MNSDIVIADSFAMIPAQQIKTQVNGIQQLMRDVMKENTHFGKIPGCGDKPTLLQPGAQKLNLMFQLADDYDIEQTNLPGSHREYKVKCTLASKQSGTVQGTGYGVCSTMESKYRYRTGPVEFTGKPVPSEYWDKRDQKLIGGKGHTAKKNPDTGLWEIAMRGEKVDNPDIADTYNTVLKIACKRALVAATLNVTAASDIFAQDLDDIENDTPTPEPPDPMDMYREALTRAKKERGVSIDDSMAAVARSIDKPQATYTMADIVEACAIVDKLDAALVAEKIRREGEETADEGNVGGVASSELLDEEIPF